MPPSESHSPLLAAPRADDLSGVWGRRWRHLFAPVDGSSLAVFRILFGLMMLLEVLRYFQTDWIADYWLTPKHHFGYWPLDFLTPLPGSGMYILFGALGVLAAMIALGLFYRLSCALFWLGFTYSFLLEQARYLNHFYLVSLVSFVLICVPAHRALSLDRLIFPRGPARPVPAWALWWVRFMVAVPYFFGGVAKLNGDWLQGEPLRQWLLGHTEIPLVGPLLAHDTTIMALAYGGLLLDLLVVPGLLFRRTRWLAFSAALAFHCLNALMFHIGIFPWFMIAATMVFFPMDWPRRLWRRATGPTGQEAIAIETQQVRLSRRQKWIAAGLLFWVAVQIFLPLRHFLIPGNVHWTEEGHRWAWHMKLRSKQAAGNFWVVNRANGRREMVNEEDYLVDFQMEAMRTKPCLIWQFAQLLREDYRQRGEDVKVFANLSVSLNGRKYQQFTNPQVDLARVRRPVWPTTNWILPLED